jgi:multidrug efflux pump subunit AcrA (membrane-fusion protein)
MIKPNVLAKMKFNDYTEKNAMVVPSIILKQDMKGTYLFTVKDNKAQKIYVETGKSYHGNTMITKGLNIGDKVIIDGYNQVSDGKLVETL